MSLPPTSLSGFIMLSFSSRNCFWLFRCPDLVWKPGKNEANAFPISLMEISLLFQVPLPGSAAVLCAGLYNTLKAPCIPVLQCDSLSTSLHYQYSLGQLAFYWHLSNHPQPFSVTLYEWQSLPRLPELLDTFPFRQFAAAYHCLYNLRTNCLLLSSLTSSFCLMFSSKWDLFKAGSPPSSEKGKVPMVLWSLL